MALIVATGIGLSMDAFAVAICKGLAMRRINWKHAVIIALFFGAFQALMPFLGWAVGRTFESLIAAFDHWIAFGLLVFLGGKFLFDALRRDEAEGAACDIALDVRGLLMLSIATSIDALAVGIAMAALKVNILSACAVIGAITFVISFAGVAVGNFFGNRFQKKAEITGGIILILIGLNILLEHLHTQ